MVSVTYGKCYLWQRYYGKCNYGKDIMANETEPGQSCFFVKRKCLKNEATSNLMIINLFFSDICVDRAKLLKQLHFMKKN